MHHHGAGPYAEAGQAAGRCVEAGQACLAHCLVLLGNGDASLAACSKSVNQMLALCTALQSLANQQSPMTPGLAKVCFDACSSCEKECRKHEDEHAECRACAESCAGCAKACKDIMA